MKKVVRFNRVLLWNGHTNILNLLTCFPVAERFAVAAWPGLAKRGTAMNVHLQENKTV